MRIPADVCACVTSAWAIFILRDGVAVLFDWFNLFFLDALRFLFFVAFSWWDPALGRFLDRFQ